MNKTYDYRTRGKSDSFDEKIDGRQLSRFIIRLLSKYPLLLISLILLGILVAAGELFSIMLFIPFLQKITGGAGLGNAELPFDFLSDFLSGFDIITAIQLIAVALVVVEGIKGLLKYLNGLVSCQYQIRLDRYLRLKVFDQMLQSNIGYLKKDMIANLFTILNNYTRVASVTSKAVAASIPNFFIFLLVFVYLLKISVIVTFVVFTLGVVVYLILGRQSRRAGEMGRQYYKHYVGVNHDGFEMLNGITFIKLFAQEERIKNKFDLDVENLQKISFKQGKIESKILPLTSFFLILFIACIIILSTITIHANDQFIAQQIVLFLVVFSRVASPLSNINQLRVRIANVAAAMQMLDNFLQQQQYRILEDGKTDFRIFEKHIRFENVSFQYEKDGPEVIKNLSLEIPKDKVTAIVGESGSGKSTILALLARLYDPTQGKITVDGIDLRDLKVLTWRRQFGIVSQNSFLFNDTILNNIKFGKFDADKEMVVNAAKLAVAHKFIMNTKDGYDARVGDFGVGLSGGEIQRIAIARAILVDPSILILDEATSSLDSASEKEFKQALSNAARQRTVVAVAHRLSTVQDADNIIVIDKGSIVESGSHQDLVAKNGLYAKFHALQQGH